MTDISPARQNARHYAKRRYTKVCYTCLRSLPRSEFHKAKHNYDGLNNHCIECQRAKSKAAKPKRTTKPINKPLKEAFWNIQRPRCQVCGESEPCCLCFHHLDPSQKETLVSKCWDGRDVVALHLELAKCAVLCHNCHSKVHAGVLTTKLQPIHQADEFIDAICKHHNDRRSNKSRPHPTDPKPLTCH